LSQHIEIVADILVGIVVLLISEHNHNYHRGTFIVLEVVLKHELELVIVVFSIEFKPDRFLHLHIDSLASIHHTLEEIVSIMVVFVLVIAHYPFLVLQIDVLVDGEAPHALGVSFDLLPSGLDAGEG
jgi:hypothetical protein